ncbi:DUF4926 domain-containing protein [Laspinema palackyanum]|uniref:DUF4926 domain-containing protein n=1 Tax=Laspinema palackyanum TaxID=3231601 RepID=UPI00345D0628|nr:DUF4926 domain-containing protein [Laspinema sp. D2c]
MKLLDVVALTEHLPDLNLHKGQVGTIIEVYEPDVFEVEFVDLQGKTYALETLMVNQLMPVHYQPLPRSNEADVDPDVLSSIVTEETLVSSLQREQFSEYQRDIINAYREWGDVIQLKAVHSDISNGSLPLIDGINILESAKKIVKAAALSAIEPRSYYPGKHFTQTNKYLEKVRIGQTEQGSYIFNIISPLNNEMNITGEESKSDPYERKVVKTLFRALSSLTATSEQQEDLTNAVEQGISGNLCEAIAEMGGSQKRLGFSFCLLNSPSLELPGDIPKEIVLPAELLPKIEQLGKKLKERKITKRKHRTLSDSVEEVSPNSLQEPTLTQIEGFVVRLEWSGGDKKAKVTIVATIEDEEKEVTVELEKNEYLLAIQANVDQIPVTGYGVLIPEKDGLILKETRSFRIQNS